MFFSLSLCVCISLSHLLALSLFFAEHFSANRRIKTAPAWPVFSPASVKRFRCRVAQLGRSCLPLPWCRRAHAVSSCFPLTLTHPFLGTYRLDLVRFFAACMRERHSAWRKMHSCAAVAIALLHNRVQQWKARTTLTHFCLPLTFALSGVRGFATCPQCLKTKCFKCALLRNGGCYAMISFPRHRHWGSQAPLI